MISRLISLPSGDEAYWNVHGARSAALGAGRLPMLREGVAGCRFRWAPSGMGLIVGISKGKISS